MEQKKKQIRNLLHKCVYGRRDCQIFWREKRNVIEIHSLFFLWKILSLIGTLFCVQYIFSCVNEQKIDKVKL